MTSVCRAGFVVALVLTLAACSVASTIGRPPTPTAVPPASPPTGPVGIASTDWPSDRFMFVAWPNGQGRQERPFHLFRSQDAGDSWQRISNPSSSIRPLTIAVGPLTVAGRSIFAVAEPNWVTRADRYRVYRSVDEGDTWQEVLSTPPYEGVRLTSLVISPDFANDGVALLNVDGHLYRTSDSGNNWVEVTASSNDLFFRNVRFTQVPGSPQLVFASLVSSASGMVIRAAQPSTRDDHVRSPGVVVSWDSGETWQPTASQPEVGRVPYRQIQDLVVSPTYDRDRTIVVFASGPEEQPIDRTEFGGVKPAALFLSTDSGTSWSSIWRPVLDARRPEPSPGAPVRPLIGQVALSRFFSQDRQLVLILTGSVSPTSGMCHVLRTGDGGQTWAPIYRFFGDGGGARCHSFPGPVVDVPGSQRHLLPEALLPYAPFQDMLVVGSDGRLRKLVHHPNDGMPPTPFPMP